ncbi:MAG: PQQ-binding-like beta-propeller repeat protein [Pirellulaceae bacterium]|nr:PQQ-binding-like beta-propeller repeat protein [Pirellulaceae bacterium]
MKYRYSVAVTCFLMSASLSTISIAGDWTRFRGPNGSGISPDTTPTPTSWSMTENLRWKTELPGPGLSSPIVIGNRIFVTCYTGYGDRKSKGSMQDLKRHLVCVDRSTGKTLWTATIPAVQPEDAYEAPGVTSHGYSSHTPTSDGERVYVFLGKTGVLAFNLDGKQLWQTSVGTESGRQRWGSAASPIVHGDNLIVNASEESAALIALDKKTGKETWRAEAAGLASSWATPIVANSSNGEEIVLSVPNETWSFIPDTGKLKWFAKGNDDSQTSSSLIAGENVVYSFGGRGGNSVAIRTGGKDDVNATNIAWEGRASIKFTTPILYEGYIYNMSGGIASCYDAKTGERKYQSRVASGAAVSDEETNAGRGGPGGGGTGDSDRGGQGGGERGGPGGGERGGPGGGERGGPGGGRGGRGGGGGGGDYASPVIAAGKIIYTTKAGKFYIVDAKPEFALVATNDLSADISGFNGTPAISDGELFLRSNEYLYCVSEK